MSTLKAIAAAVKVATDAAAAALASLGNTNTAKDTATAQAALATAKAAALDNRIYPGTYAADPAARPDTTPPQNGDVCTLTSGVMRVRIAGAWQDWTTASAAAAAASAATATTQAAAATTQAATATAQAALAATVAGIEGGAAATVFGPFDSFDGGAAGAVATQTVNAGGA